MLGQLKALAIFAQVAETGSFRAAAKQLKLSPSVVSTQISNLEERLGKALIYRSTRKISLTQAGQDLLIHAQKVVDAAEEGLVAAEGSNKAPSGRVRVSVPSDFQHGRFVNDVARFAKEFEEINVDIIFTDYRSDLIAEGIDVAIRLDAYEDSTLKATKVLAGRRRLFASAEYLADNPEIKHPQDLQQHRLIYSAGLRPALTFTHNESGEHEAVKVEFRVSSNTGFSALRLVDAGVGLACLPSFVVSSMGVGSDLVEVLPEWSPTPYNVFFVWPANTGSRSAARYFMDFLRAKVESEPPPAG